MANQTQSERRLKMAKGPWTAKDSGTIEGWHVYAKPHADGSDYAPLLGYRGGAISKDDATLLADAGNVYHSLDLTPSQIAEDRRLLIEALTKLRPSIPHQAECVVIRPSEEWDSKGSVSFECRCGLSAIDALLARVQGGR